jgi:hypothetical protein
VYAKRAKHATEIDKAVACLCYLSYLAYLRPAADLNDPVLSWVVSRDCLYGLLLADSIIQKCEERRSDFGLFASKRSKAFSRRLLKSTGREECKNRNPKLANPINRRTTSSKHVKKRDAPLPHRKPLREENGRMGHSARLSATWINSRLHLRIANQLAGGSQYYLNN